MKKSYPLLAPVATSRAQKWNRDCVTTAQLQKRKNPLSWKTMVKLIVSVAAFVAALAVGGFFLIRHLSTEEAIIRAAGLDPWIEVIASPVFELDPATGRETRELATGDELKAGLHR